jgi:hypothetical protein
VAVIAQVSAHDRSDWRLRRHSGGTLKGGFSESFRHISSLFCDMIKIVNGTFRLFLRYNQNSQ